MWFVRDACIQTSKPAPSIDTLWLGKVVSGEVLLEAKDKSSKISSTLYMARFSALCFILIFLSCDAFEDNVDAAHHAIPKLINVQIRSAKPVLSLSM